MKKLQNVVNLEERKVLVRVDFNVPLGKDGILTSSEDWRIEKSLDTINFLHKSGAKTILISHIGRKKTDSLKPVADYLQKFMPVTFIPTWDEEEIVAIVSQMKAGEIIMLENLRQNPGEEENDDKFASFLASLASMYVNEAFSVSHRAHASIVGVPDYIESFAGFWLQKEVENLSKVLKDPAKPFLFILGGAKFDTKIDLIKSLQPLLTSFLLVVLWLIIFFKRLDLMLVNLLWIKMRAYESFLMIHE
jgi:phosphoglycerate kinase